MAIFVLLLLAAATVAVDGEKHHFLMIASDDMRPEMSVYGHEYMNTPNFQVSNR